MIGILLNDMAYEQDIRELLMAFYPGEGFVHANPAEQAEASGNQQRNELRFSVIGMLSDDRKMFDLRIVRDGATQSCIPGETAVPDEGKPLQVDYENRFDTKNKIKRRLYRMLMEQTGKKLPWGTLTGIRPTKIALTRLEEGMSETEIARHMKETYYTSDEKIALGLDIAKREYELLAALDYKHGYSLYVGIPFCPTTCLYCSFTSYPIGKWLGRTGLYLDALFKELDYVAERMAGRPLDTIYFGGGTPTALPAEDLDRLLTKVRTTFPCEQAREFTVEAGRPDSIMREKFEVLKKHAVTRISINPQTMNQKTLDLIGRRHTVEMVEDAYFMAREMGFDNINMDLIVGLPGETKEDVAYTLERVKALHPDSLTVHSLAIKRAARLNTMKDVYRDYKIENTQEMIDMTAQCAKELGLLPYYLYRQKNMAGNFENVGYAAPGKACIYNILIMEEKQTIAACGAGTTTKVLFAEENRLERAENAKNVETYIEHLDEMIARKERLLGR